MGPAGLWTCIWKWPFHYDVIYILKTGETDWMMISTGNSFQDGQNIDILAQNKWSEINLHKELTNNEALLWPPKQLSLLSQTDRWDWDQLSNFLSKYCKLASKCSFIHDYALPTYRQKTFSTIQTLTWVVLKFLQCFISYFLFCTRLALRSRRLVCLTYVIRALLIYDFLSYFLIPFANLSHSASIGWVALSSLVWLSLSHIGNISTYLHNMMF